MNLMTGSTDFPALQNKYRNFGAPTIRLRVEDVEILEKMDAMISNVAVELSNGASATGCSFDVIGEYDPKNTGFNGNGPEKLLQLGAKVELELGYIETVPVFFGLIAELEYVFENEDSAPFIHVECMDAKCVLMKRQRLELFSAKSITEAVGEIFDAQPFSDYIKGKTVDALTDKLDMIPAAMEDDFQFCTRCAAYIGYEFFILAGQVYFRKTPSGSSSIMTLSPEYGLSGVKLSLRGASLHKKTKVVGIGEQDGKMVSGEQAAGGKFAKNQNAARMMGESERTHFDHMVKSADEAAARAGTLMQMAVGEFGRIECKCVGIPELVPGRSITVKGVSPEADRDFYIISVRHTFDDNGFFTTLEARLNTL